MTRGTLTIPECQATFTNPPGGRLPGTPCYGAGEGEDQTPVRRKRLTVSTSPGPPHGGHRHASQPPADPAPGSGGLIPRRPRWRRPQARRGPRRPRRRPCAARRARRQARPRRCRGGGHVQAGHLVCVLLLAADRNGHGTHSVAERQEPVAIAGAQTASDPGPRCRGSTRSTPRRPATARRWHAPSAAGVGELDRHRPDARLSAHCADATGAPCPVARATRRVEAAVFAEPPAQRHAVRNLRDLLDFEVDYALRLRDARRTPRVPVREGPAAQMERAAGAPVGKTIASAARTAGSEAHVHAVARIPGELIWFVDDGDEAGVAAACDMSARWPCAYVARKKASAAPISSRWVTSPNRLERGVLVSRSRLR